MHLADSALVIGSEVGAALLQCYPWPDSAFCAVFEDAAGFLVDGALIMIFSFPSACTTLRSGYIADRAPCQHSAAMSLYGTQLKV